jgi:hypothetical protein
VVPQNPPTRAAPSKSEAAETVVVSASAAPLLTASFLLPIPVLLALLSSLFLLLRRAVAWVGLNEEGNWGWLWGEWGW